MITVERLTKQYDGKTILQEITFRVPENQTLVIRGESGCGKTTLLRILAGLERMDAGVITINGVEMTDKIPPYRRDLACVFQEATLWNHLRNDENIAFGMNCKDPEKIAEIAGRLQIADILKRYPSEISGGQAKRVALARAFAAERSILLLDEPLSNLDRETKLVTLQYLKEEFCGKKTILYVTHDQWEAEYLDCEVLTL